MYDINGRPADNEGGFSLLAVAFAVIFTLILTVFVCCSANRLQSEEQPGPTYQLVLNCSNAALMHQYGLPTKSDVLQWHVHGNWGYYQDGTLVSSHDLPGRNEVWDELYEIKPNSVFKNPVG